MMKIQEVSRHSVSNERNWSGRTCLVAIRWKIFQHTSRCEVRATSYEIKNQQGFTHVAASVQEYSLFMNIVTEVAIPTPPPPSPSVKYRDVVYSWGHGKPGFENTHKRADNSAYRTMELCGALYNCVVHCTTVWCTTVWCTVWWDTQVCPRICAYFNRSRL